VCLPPDNVAKLRKRLDVPLTEIGRVTKGKALGVLDARGKKLAVEPFGYRHFK
jgi:thiamine monophosphate kinase